MSPPDIKAWSADRVRQGHTAVATPLIEQLALYLLPVS